MKEKKKFFCASDDAVKLGADGAKAKVSKTLHWNTANEPEKNWHTKHTNDILDYWWFNLHK